MIKNSPVVENPASLSQPPVSPEMEERIEEFTRRLANILKGILADQTDRQERAEVEHENHH